MISEFEQRLVEVLGTRLPAPFSGRVKIAGAPSAGDAPLLIAGVAKAVPAEPQLGNQQPLVVPGSADPRRVVRLKCTVEIRAVPDAGRPQQVAALEAVLYALDAPDFQTGQALAAPGDPGFLIERMQIGEAVWPLEPAAGDESHCLLSLLAEGFFWPVGVAGEAGRQIGEIRIRGLALQVAIAPSQPDVVAGGPAIELLVSVGKIGALRLTNGAPPVAPLPFDSLAFALAAPGGGPGAGTLGGGVAAADGVHFAQLNNGSAAITYTPPAQAATEQLIVGFDGGAGGLGVEIGRFPIRVREG
jgi:hypothetical protein